MSFNFAFYADQGVHDSGSVATAIGACEQPCLAVMQRGRLRLTIEPERSPLDQMFA